MVKILFPAVLALSILSLPLEAESSSSYDLELYNSIYSSKDELYVSGYGTAGMNFSSEKNRNVKGIIELDFYPDDSAAAPDTPRPLFELKKAFIKVRMLDNKITLGKTRTTWGEGSVFNSGDVLFGSMTPYVDLMSEEKRDETSWMTAVTTPLGPYSFFETVFIPPQTQYTEDGITSQYPGGKIKNSSAGGRLYTRIGSTKFETGYLYKGEKRTESDPEGSYHRPYISFQGNIGPDWSLSSSAAVPVENNPDTDIIKKTFSLSFSLFHLQNIDHDSSLTLRLEGIVLPYQFWKEKERILEEYESYALLLYPEIVFNINPDFSFSLQSVISPVDISASFTLGSFWNIYQNFDLINFFTVNGGDSNDLFTWKDGSDRGINSFSITSGGRYRF